MRVTRNRVDPARFDAANHVVRDVAAAVRQLPGNQSFMGGGNRATGEGIAVSTWDTEEHARGSRDVLSDLVTRLQALGFQMDPPEIFEVITT